MWLPLALKFKLKTIIMVSRSVVGSEPQPVPGSLSYTSAPSLNVSAHWVFLPQDLCTCFPLPNDGFLSSPFPQNSDSSFRIHLSIDSFLETSLIFTSRLVFPHVLKTNIYCVNICFNVCFPNYNTSSVRAETWCLYPSEPVCADWSTAFS